MAKVYISSTVADLKGERQAVIGWLVAADHQPMHSYVADSEAVRDSCRADIERCDLYVLILGHRYGYVPEQDNPEGLSITHLEFRAAGELDLPRIALMRTGVQDISSSDLLDPARNQRVQDFHSEVRQALRPAEFNSEAELIAALSTSVPRALGAMSRQVDALRRGKHEASHNSPLKRPRMEQTRPHRPSPNPQKKSGSVWWSTLPGLLTGMAALVTAIVSLVTIFLPPTLPPHVPVTAPPVVASPVSPPVATPGLPISTAITPPTSGGQSVKTGDIGDGAEVNIQQSQ